MIRFGTVVIVKTAGGPSRKLKRSRFALSDGPTKHQEKQDFLQGVMERAVKGLTAGFFCFFVTSVASYSNSAFCLLGNSC